MFDPQLIAVGVIWFVVFLLSATAHEAAHAWMALRGGDKTAYHFGQVTLSPLPHMQREPFGMLVFPWLTFFMNGWMMGWASAPYDPYWAMRYPRRAAWMSLAGPVANFILAAIAAVLIRVGLLAGLFRPGTTMRFTDIIQAADSAPAATEAIATLLSIMFALNILLGVFNLIPLPPLDGFTAIGLVLPESMAAKLREWQMTMGAYQIFGMLIAWQVSGYVIGPAYYVGLKLLFLGY
jgi:Zn-dependent protease